jgi:hypothetical protein
MLSATIDDMISPRGRVRTAVDEGELRSVARTGALENGG